MTDHESELTPEDEQCKEVYAQYGLAAYFAQCFEKGMINFLFFRVFTEKPDTKIDKLNINDFLDDYERTLHKKTLGYLLKKAGQTVNYDPASEAIINDALEKRNFLMHNYFWERAEDMLSATGRNLIISELKELRWLFERANLISNVLGRATAQVYSASIEDEIEKEMTEMKTRALARDKS